MGKTLVNFKLFGTSPVSKYLLIIAVIGRTHIVLFSVLKWS